MRNTRCRVNVYDPGPVATRLRKEAMPGEDASRLRTPEDVAPRIAALCEPGYTGNGEMVVG